MDKLTNLSYDAVVRYFTTLSQFGYKCYNATYKLLSLIALYDLLYMFDEYITDSDLESIVKSIYCLSGSTCLIDFPKHSSGSTLFTESKVNYLTRIAEDNNIRYTQEEHVRLEA